MSFVHLHNHSDYSLLDGATKTEGLCRAAAEMGMPAVALTDHGNLCGAIELYNAAQKAGIKPIIGSELYIVEGSRKDKGKDIYGNIKPRFHLLLLAKNDTGYRNLIKLSSAGFLEGFYHRPRIDYELLEQHHEGLICLSGCIQGHLNQAFLKKSEEAALEIAERYVGIFGEDFYLELQDHGIEEEHRTGKFFVELSKKMGIKLVATNDSHYLKKEHADPHDILLCIQTHSDRNDRNRYHFTGQEFYLKSPEEMAQLFSEIPQAVKNTLEIAEKVELKFDFSRKHFPYYPLPEGEGVTSHDEYLRTLCEQGLPERYDTITDNIRQRLETELEVIGNKQLSDYLLIVRDFIAHAKSQGIPVGPGRGSAAGCLVSYLIGITNIDPIRYDLLFERFINPERESYPDIDVDFSDIRRAEVIEYVRKKYGGDNVCQIITFGRMMAKGVIRDVGRVLQIPLSEVDAIIRKIPDDRNITLDRAMKESDEFRELINSRAEYRELMDRCLVLEGTIRNAGVHAAGVVITPGPLTDYVPLFKAPDSDVTTQYDMKYVEQIGLLKVDFLGLKTLTILERTLELLRTRGINLTLEEIPLDDKETYELFSRGDTIGIFQFESGGMRDNLGKLKPERLEDLIAMNALYRPGPMKNIGDFIARKHGQQKISYLHPLLKDILEETYGIIVYQEQVIRIVNILGGLSLGRADVIRRAMGKKKYDLMEQLKPEFIEGCKANSIKDKTAEKIWDLIKEFAEYGFNKSHAAGYALVAYQTAYLKTHYPAEFMAASMTSRRDNTNELVLFLEECRRMELDVLPPDVNESFEDFTVTKKGAVRFGLGAIKNVGSAAIQAILGERISQGHFRSLFDLAKTAVKNPLVNRKVLEALILAGATESLQGHRAQQLAMLDQVLAYAQQLKQEQNSGQVNIFGESEGSDPLPHPELPDIPEMPSRERLANEKELLGFYFSGHPLLRYRCQADALSSHAVHDLLENGSHETQVRIAGLFSSLVRKKTRKGGFMGRGRFEDLTGTIPVIIFPRDYERISGKLEEDKAVLVFGKVTYQDDKAELFVEDVQPLEDAAVRMIRRIELTVDEAASGNHVLALEKLFREHTGDSVVHFHFVTEEGDSFAMQSGRYRIKPVRSVLNRLEELLGKEKLRIVPLA